MGLTSAMTTSLTGLQAAETSIEVVGNNIANSNTIGFKQSTAVFATQFLQTQSIGSAPNQDGGGTNPRQIGLGVKVAEITPDFTQGTIEISSNPLDLAIEGDGFLIVQGASGEQLYTRSGQLSVNAQNEIVTTTGQRVLGYGVDDDFEVQRTSLVSLAIPVGSAAVAQATENVTLEGNLSPQATLGEPGVITSGILSNGSIEFPSDLTIADVSASQPPNVLASTTVATTTGGSVGAGTYNYRIAFVDFNGLEGSSSTEFGPVTVGGGDDSIQLDNLPEPSGDPNFVAQRIYRTDATGTGGYRLVAELNPTATSYSDTASDASIAGASLLDESAVDQNDYSYQITFYNTSTGIESRPTAELGPVNISNVGRRIHLNNIPKPTTSEFNAVRIYRNTASESDFLLVDTITDLSPAVVSYVDSTPDATIEAAGTLINLDGPVISPGLELVNLVSRDGASYSNVFEEGTLSFIGKKGGRDLGSKELTITSTTTVQNLIDFMDEAMGVVSSTNDPNFPIPGSPGGLVTGESRIEFTSNMGLQNELGIDLSAFQITQVGSSVTETANIGFTSVQTAVGEGASTDVVVYDSLGIPVNVRITTYLEASDGNSFTYRWFADSPQNEPVSGSDTSVGTGVLTFDGNGDLVFASQTNVSVDRRDTASASPLEFDLDFSRINGLPPDNADEELSFVNATSQDGFPPGILTTFDISRSGLVRGVFSNGTSRPLGQIQMARFANASGLEQGGDGIYRTGVNSGLPILGDPGTQGIGSLTSGAVELSNTDIGQNLIELILASTQYRGGARVITAAQELLDELMALRR